MLRPHIFFDSLIPPKNLVKNPKRSETPSKIYKQMKNSVFIVRNLWIWRYSSLFDLWKNYRFVFPYYWVWKNPAYIQTISPSFRRVASTKSNEFGSSSWLLRVFYFIKWINPRVPVNYSNLPRCGIFFATREFRFKEKWNDNAVECGFRVQFVLQWLAMIYCSNNNEWLKPVIPKWQINPGTRKVWIVNKNPRISEHYNMEDVK